MNIPLPFREEGTSPSLPDREEVSWFATRKGNHMIFFLDIEPPTVTAQERRVKMIKGRPMFYDSPRLREAKALFIKSLEPFKPDQPLDGPVRLDVLWKFKHGKSHKDGEWRITRPDTDNLEKLLKDCMSYVGFWNDDAQVCIETIQKRWDNKCGINIAINEVK